MATQLRIPPNTANAAESFLYDGSTVFVGGQDASKVPAQVPEGNYFAGVNIQVSKGVPVPRWALDKKKLIFPEGGITLPNSFALVTYEEVFRSGKFQVQAAYNVGSDQYQLVVVSGYIFLINQVTYEVTFVPIQGGSTLNENTPRLNHAPADKYYVIHDYPNFPVILEGITARRADPAKDEIPVSVGGAYNQNRYFIYNAGNEYTAGDPTGSLAAPQAPITFLEVETPGSPVFGEIFALPTDRIEPITAMGFLQLTDTSTGIGPLLIGTKNAIYSAHTEIPRTVLDNLGNPIRNWEQNGFATAFVLNAGIAGFRAWTNVNSDFFFVSSDGQVRSATMSRQEQGQWARVPISKEVQNWIKFWDKSLVEFTTMAYFNNKVLISVNPFRTSALNSQREPVFDVAFGGFIVLSLDNVATLGHDGAPAWDGLWTGVRPMDIVANGNRLFVMAKDEAFRNELYEFLPEQTYDSDGSNIRYINSTVYSREYGFNSPFQDKDLHSIDFDIRNIAGDFKLTLSYKPTQGTQFIPWQTFTHCAPWRDCAFPTDDEINGLAQHNFTSLTLGSPTEGCDPASQLPYSTFRKLQLKLELEGKYWEVQGYRIKATYRPQDQQINLACDVGSCVKVAKECSTTDWYIGPFKSCLTQVT